MLGCPFAPAFEEKGHIGGLALIAQKPHTLRVHGARAGAGFAPAYHPMEQRGIVDETTHIIALIASLLHLQIACQINLPQQRLQAHEPFGRRCLKQYWDLFVCFLLITDRDAEPKVGWGPLYQRRTFKRYNVRSLLTNFMKTFRSNFGENRAHPFGPFGEENESMLPA